MARLRRGEDPFVVQAEIETYQVLRRERGARMEEGPAIIKGLWEQDTVSFEGRFYTLPEFSIRPRPVQARTPLWVAATVDRAFERAARFGAHLAGTAHGYDLYDRYLREYGSDPADFNRGMLMFMHLASTRAGLGRGRALRHRHTG